MSNRFAVLGKTTPVSSNDLPGIQSSIRLSEYTELIQRLFHGSSVIAIIGAGVGNGITGICEEIASELSRLGRSVVLVSVKTLLQVNPITLSDATALMPEGGRNYWLWPSPGGQRSEFFQYRTPAEAKKWLDSLRRDFDSVLLDCPALETGPGGAAIAAMAEAAVFAVDAARNPKHQILLHQRHLQLMGVKLEGCILINTR